MNRTSSRSAISAAVFAMGAIASAQDTSAPAILQIFDASWTTIEDRSVDAWAAGYGSVWMPPPGRAETGGFSVGYDVYDRFNLGNPDDRTLYGTESELRAAIGTWQRFGAQTYADLIWNHNGFSDRFDSEFVASGGYPGFVFQGEGGTGGDFHTFVDSVFTERISGLIDIDHSSNIQFVRNPVPGFNNVPAGTTPYFGLLADQPTEANRRFYTDLDGPGRTYFDPTTNETFTVHDFNRFTGDETTDWATGDPVEENALGYLMRNAQWMIQDVGFDGFRLDAVKHVEPWVFNYLDRAVYEANPRLLLDGSINHVFSFGEAFEGNAGIIQQYIRKDLVDGSNSVGGNRDALDFPLHFALKANLTGNGFGNDWRNILNASQDLNDDGLNNGSQGVSFDASHDENGAFLGNVANAYLLMRPGNHVTYFNAEEFGPNRDFPKDGRGDALGGLYGDTITTLVGIRNTHGRGNFLPHLVEQNQLIYEREKSALVVLSSRTDEGFDERTVSTTFEPGTYLIELTGKAALDADIPELVQVDGNGNVDLRVQRANGGDGYLVYGLATPQGELSLSNVDFILEGGTPTAATNGTTRLTDLHVVSADTFQVQLQTEEVNLLGQFRDPDADGDSALLKLNGGLDANGNGRVDFVQPGSVAYGFELFTDKSSPLALGGDGEFLQTVDTTQLPEGVNFVEVIAFRQRDDGGPPVYSSFKKALYVDRLAPEVEFDEAVSFNGATEGERDLLVKSTDQTANSVHVFVNLPASLTDEQILSFVNGSNRAEQIDRDIFKYYTDGLIDGNHALTTVTFEVTGNVGIQRLAGVYIDGIGAGLGDVNADGVFDTTDVIGAGGFEQFLYARDTQFNAAADIDGDGRVTSADLFALEAIYMDELSVDAAAEARAAELRRGNVNQFGSTDAFDIDDLRANFGTADGSLDDWYYDLSGDGVIDTADVDLIVEEVFETAYGDTNLDGFVDVDDFLILIENWQEEGGWADGDSNGSGVVDKPDLFIINANYGFGYDEPLEPVEVLIDGQPYRLGVNVPEPSTVLTLAAAACLMLTRTRRSKDRPEVA
ncbi:MAG: hypothetical protein AAGD32_09370 [Planctomycetota bacterium]